MSVTQLLGPSSYLSYLGKAGDGCDANTHKARVEFGPGTPVDAHVKVYDEGDAPNGLVDELIGYVLAKHAASMCRCDPRSCCCRMPRRATCLMGSGR